MNTPSVESYSLNCTYTVNWWLKRLFEVNRFFLFVLILPLWTRIFYANVNVIPLSISFSTEYDRPRYDCSFAKRRGAYAVWLAEMTLLAKMWLFETCTDSGILVVPSSCRQLKPYLSSLKSLLLSSTDVLGTPVLLGAFQIARSHGKGERTKTTTDP